MRQNFGDKTLTTDPKNFWIARSSNSLLSRSNKYPTTTVQRTSIQGYCVRFRASWFGVSMASSARKLFYMRSQVWIYRRRSCRTGTRAQLGASAIQIGPMGVILHGYEASVTASRGRNHVHRALKMFARSLNPKPLLNHWALSPKP